MATRCELAKKYFKANPTPIQGLCPNIRQYWRTATGTMLWDNESLERREINSHSCQPSYNWTAEEIWITPRSEYEGFYLHNVADLDALEVAKVRVNGNRGKNGEKKVWHYSPYGERYLIFKGDTSVYEPSGFAYAGEKYYSKMLLDFIGSDCRCAIHGPHSHEEWKKFMGHAVESKWYNDCDNPCPQMYREAYKRNFMPRKTSNRAKEFASYAFAEYDVDPVLGFDYHMLVEIPDENYCVLRCFKSISPWEIRNGAEPGFREYLRIFIDSKGKPSSLTYENGKWKIVSNSGWYADHKHHVVNPEKFEEWKPLKYIVPVLNMGELNPKSVMTVLRHPIVEQLSKAGYKHTAKILMEDNQVGANMKDIFRAEKETKQSFFRVLGVNKYVLEAVNDKDDIYMDATVRQLKRAFGTEDISFLSKETVELYMNGFRASGSDWEGIVDKTYYWWESRNNRWCNTPTEEERHLIEKLYRLEQKEPGVARAYKDAKGIYSRLNNKPEIDWKDFRHAEDIINLHDNLQALMNVEDAERRRLREMADEERKKELEKKFKKLQEDRIEKFECTGEKYSMLVPHDLAEITTEGQSLHHCVGGYLDRHAQGQTNIIFLRQNSVPTVPFYTIEVDNSGNVIQIHGLYNRWLGNDPDAISFVWKWIQDRGFRCEKYKLLNTGAGYGQGKDEVSESYLVA